MFTQCLPLPFSFLPLHSVSSLPTCTPLNSRSNPWYNQGVMQHERESAVLTCPGRVADGGTRVIILDAWLVRTGATPPECQWHVDETWVTWAVCRDSALDWTVLQT